MDYEKKYKDALAKAREIHRNEDEKRRDMEWLFPELKNKDEEIRKALIKGVESCKASGWTNFGNNVDIDVVLAWLKEQGKQKPIDYNKELKKCRENPLYFFDKYVKLEKQKPVLDFKASNFYVSKVDGKIHDMTYNPTDKVEPKFKVKYAGSEYNVLEVKDIAGVTFYGIEDEPNHIDYVQADNCEIISGYAIKENGSSYPTNPAVFSEQKPFDYENVNIQQKDFASVGETATIELSSPIDCGDRIYHVSHKPIEKNGEQKPAWSEEDENYLQNAENAFEYQNSKNSSTILWLKSLKNRVQHQEWSEEDEVELDNAIYACLNFYGKDSDTADWLKSLKDRIGG